MNYYIYIITNLINNKNISEKEVLAFYRTR